MTDEELEERLALIKQALLALDQRASKLEERTPNERVMNHEGIAVGVGAGLGGGGTIDRSISIGLRFSELYTGAPRLGNELFPFWSPDENLHCVVPFSALAEKVLNLSGVWGELKAIREQIKLLSETVQLLTVYDRLERIEEELEEARARRKRAEEGVPESVR